MPTGTLSGLLVYPIQTVPAAELTADAHCLKFSAPGATYGFDASIIGTGSSGGRDWCSAPSCPGADLWRTFWGIYENVGHGIVELHKVKARRKRAHRGPGSGGGDRLRGRAAGRPSCVHHSLKQRRKRRMFDPLLDCAHSKSIALVRLPLQGEQELFFTSATCYFALLVPPFARAVVMQQGVHIVVKAAKWPCASRRYPVRGGEAL